MAKQNGIPVHLVGLEKGEEAPEIALYQLGDDGMPAKKLAVASDGMIDVDPARLKGARIAIGPDTDDIKSLPQDMLVKYRADQVVGRWIDHGLMIPKDRWISFLWQRLCVSGHVRKCRPWWYDILTPIRISSKLGVQKRLPMASQFDGPRLDFPFPFRCVPVCEGVVEVFERYCCCHRIIYDDLIDRLREVLERIPIPIDWPVPPEPDPWRAFGGISPVEMLPAASGTPHRMEAAYGDGPRLESKLNSAMNGGLQIPDLSERIYRDYQALLALDPYDVDAFVEARPYLFGYICSCTMRKVGEAPIQPGGEFDFCYRRPWRWPGLYRRCTTTFAYRVKQKINGIWVTVYDGVAGRDYHALGEYAHLHTSNPATLVCGDGPLPPDEGDGTAFVSLQYVTGYETRHYNFPTQTGLSNVAALNANSGLYDFVGVPDCPWATSLELFLWFSPSLEGTVSFYRMKVVRVNAAGDPVGAWQDLAGSVSWARNVGDLITTEDLAADPTTVGGETNLYKVPYWSNGMNWLYGQPHQIWNTASGTFPDGRYMLVLELFGPGGARIKPNGAPAGDPGTAKAFQFRRWTSGGSTANVPFGDCAHIFWVNNTPVAGDIIDLRKDHVPSSDECQFMSGPGNTTFSVGFSAYHVDGVTTGGGVGDTNSFMRGYGLTWQRGLNGPVGTLETGTSDRGEPPSIAESNTLDFASMLGVHRRCTFSVHLHVGGKHQNGGSFIYSYDYHETASFALEQTTP